MSRNEWSIDEIDKLRNMYLNNVSGEQMSEVLGRTLYAVRYKLCDLRISKNNLWTKEEDDFITKNIQTR